jgi:hypothetical protein
MMASKVRVSIDRLMGFLTSFDRDVEIVVKPHKKKAGLPTPRVKPARSVTCITRFGRVQ